MKIANNMKEKIDDIKKRVEELEHNLSANFVSKDVYKLEIDGINKRIEDIETDIDKLSSLPDKVDGNCKDIDGYNKILSKIAWFVFFSILGAFLAFVYRGGLI